MSMSVIADALMPASAERPSDRQRTFLRYYTGTLIDLVVLGLFAEFTDKVIVESFSIGLLAALVLQLLLKATIALEHVVAAYFNSKPGGFMKFMRWFTAWLILFGSKFVILEALSFAFGGRVRFQVPLDGNVWRNLVVLVKVVSDGFI